MIDCDTLKTLDARQVGAGLGEVIKYGCIADEALFEKIERLGSRAALTRRSWTRSSRGAAPSRRDGMKTRTTTVSACS